MTGGVSAKHDILRVNTYKIDADDYVESNMSSGQKSRHRPKIDSSGLGTTFWIFILLVIGGVGYVAWNINQQAKQRQYKRF